VDSAVAELPNLYWFFEVENTTAERLKVRGLIAGTLFFWVAPLVHGAGSPARQWADHLGAALHYAREAREAVIAGNSEFCRAAIKKAKQSCKEVAGDLADRPSQEDTLGKPMDEAMKRLKDPRTLCEQGINAEGEKTLAEVAMTLERLQSNVGR
jgi:hypothetical protein